MFATTTELCGLYKSPPVVLQYDYLAVLNPVKAAVAIVILADVVDQNLDSKAEDNDQPAIRELRLLDTDITGETLHALKPHRPLTLLTLGGDDHGRIFGFQGTEQPLRELLAARGVSLTRLHVGKSGWTMSSKLAPLLPDTLRTLHLVRRHPPRLGIHTFHPLESTSSRTPPNIFGTLDNHGRVAPPHWDDFATVRATVAPEWYPLSQVADPISPSSRERHATPSFARPNHATRLTVVSTILDNALNAMLEHVPDLDHHHVWLFELSSFVLARVEEWALLSEWACGAVVVFGLRHFIIRYTKWLSCLQEDPPPSPTAPPAPVA
ncbi:hypothetical protein BDK51DRAFT_47218 [Blyttiomyces helicus]|uniref:Uncharacterized protein n=1 Tax=Blyttiomyces helicus TaxID=388810 RepID=A0A4P9W2T3_9FUNG|nr:hypothetical protein BDK51DRAFT_47218 [Blyttiomyces helicus]|eukprot:RKO85695.1 hypothetical protein BDK51DRAFT_47218 [Blyttiomyces helicus]